jgi:hypothetical protein
VVKSQHQIRAKQEFVFLEKNGNYRPITNCSSNYQNSLLKTNLLINYGMLGATTKFWVLTSHIILIRDTLNQNIGIIVELMEMHDQ